MTTKRDKAAIRKWMRAHIAEFVDECGEVSTTKLAEAWDAACANGKETLHPDHMAWYIAVEVADEVYPK